MSDTATADGPHWVWNAGEGAFVWWDGQQFTTAHAYWSLSGWVTADGPHPPQGAVPGPSPPGWYEAPGEPSASRYWNGRRWTHKYRRRATQAALRAMVALSSVGVGLAVWGAAVSFHSSAGSYPSELRDYYCSGGHTGELVPESLWAIWAALAITALAALVLYARTGVGDRRMATLAGLGVAAAMITCPLLLIIGAGADCAL